MLVAAGGKGEGGVGCECNSGHFTKFWSVQFKLVC